MVSAGTLAVGDVNHQNAALAGGGIVAINSGAMLGGYGSVTGTVANDGTMAVGNALSAFAADAPGNFTVIGTLLNNKLVNLAGTAVGNTLTVAGNYVGNAGMLHLNTFLGGDGSPTDRLIINGNGRSATGNTLVDVTNVGGPGAGTTNGILLVNAINGATTATSAFTLANPELRIGAFDYRLFRGSASNPALANDWFLRSAFLVPPVPPLLPNLPSTLPTTPPPNPLPPGVYPIIGPELATYGVVQPLARDLGLTILDTLDDRVGDTYEPDSVAPAVASGAPAVPPTTNPGAATADEPLFSPSAWGRFFGQTIDNHYQAFADPRASGDLGGFQLGMDLLRGSLAAGHYERAGLYGALGNTNVNVEGLVANAQATGYILSHTGSLNLKAYSGGAYWTHVGPGGWYVDTVVQGTSYDGSAGTQFAKLDTVGWGFLASLEGGYPFALGSSFVLEPQVQIAWQKVSFGQRNDGLGQVALGDTSGETGRLGLRGKWTIETRGSQVWQPYVRVNAWKDWGAQANTVYSGASTVPLVTSATRLQFGGGVTGKLNANSAVYASADYQLAVGDTTIRRDGFRGTVGFRYTW
jgi:outer membrane autotransporter protein